MIIFQLGKATHEHQCSNQTSLGWNPALLETALDAGFCQHDEYAHRFFYGHGGERRNPENHNKTQHSDPKKSHFVGLQDVGKYRARIEGALVNKHPLCGLELDMGRSNGAYPK
jgi:hypothetical protein